MNLSWQKTRGLAQEVQSGVGSRVGGGEGGVEDDARAYQVAAQPPSADHQVSWRTKEEILTHQRYDLLSYWVMKWYEINQRSYDDTLSSVIS